MRLRLYIAILLSLSSCDGFDPLAINGNTSNTMSSEFCLDSTEGCMSQVNFGSAEFKGELHCELTVDKISISLGDSVKVSLSTEDKAIEAKLNYSYTMIVPTSTVNLSPTETTDYVAEIKSADGKIGRCGTRVEVASGISPPYTPPPVTPPTTPPTTPPVTPPTTPPVTPPKPPVTPPVAPSPPTTVNSSCVLGSNVFTRTCSCAVGFTLTSASPISATSTTACRVTKKTSIGATCSRGTTFVSSSPVGFSTGGSVSKVISVSPQCGCTMVCQKPATGGNVILK